MIRSCGVAFLGALIFPLAALAQDEPAAGTSGCLTQGADICLVGGSARLSAAEGEVLLSRGERFAQIGAGEGLSPGDRVLVKKGSATLALGPSCRTKVGKNSMLAITQQDGITCATSVTTDPTTVGADLPSRRAPPPPVPIAPVAAVPFGWAPVAIGAGIAGIAACAIFCEGEGGRRIVAAPIVPVQPAATSQ
jgi:hypothetical protein